MFVIRPFIVFLSISLSLSLSSLSPSVYYFLTDSTCINHRLFQIDPFVQQKFPFRDVAYEDLEDDESFLKHSLLVMETIDAAISLVLDKDFSKLQETLMELGAAHAMQGLKTGDFDVSVYLCYAKCGWQQSLISNRQFNIAHRVIEVIHVRVRIACMQFKGHLLTSL